MATIRRRKSTWQVQIRRQGHQLSRTFHLKADAERWARQREAELDRGGLPSDSRRLRTHTLADLLRRVDLAVGAALSRHYFGLITRLVRNEEVRGSTPLGSTSPHNHQAKKLRLCRSMIPKKLALGLDPRVDTGFRKRSCPNNRLKRNTEST